MASSERPRVSGIMTTVSMPPRIAQAASSLIVPISPMLPEQITHAVFVEQFDVPHAFV
jgi:hypothetical protein